MPISLIGQARARARSRSRCRPWRCRRASSARGPVTSAACVKRRACCSPFWPVVASIVSSVSCGAPAQALRDHAAHLGELLHQVLLGVQAARGVDDHDAAPARDAGADGVERDGGGIRAAGGADEVGLRALGPGLELLGRGRAERVGGADHDARTRLVQLVGELADRGRLAGAVDARPRGSRRDRRAGRARGARAAAPRRSATMRCSSSRSSSGVCRRPAADSASSACTISTVAGTPTSAAIRSSSSRSQTPSSLGSKASSLRPCASARLERPQVLAQAREEAAAALLRLGGTLGRGRQAQQDVLPGHLRRPRARARGARARWRRRRRPSRRRRATSAISIVSCWWVMMMNCARSR